MVATPNAQAFIFTTNDDYRDRYIKTLFVGLATPGISVALYITGQEYSVVDLTRFAAGDSILEMEFKAPAKLQLQVQLTDLAGAAHANVPVVIGYTVDPTSGP